MALECGPFEQPGGYERGRAAGLHISDQHQAEHHENIGVIAKAGGDHAAKGGQARERQKHQCRQ